VSRYTAAQLAARCEWLGRVAHGKMVLLDTLATHSDPQGSNGRLRRRLARAAAWSACWERLRYHYRQMAHAQREGWEMDGPRPLWLVAEAAKVPP